MVATLFEKKGCQVPSLLPGKNATAVFPVENTGPLQFLTPSRLFPVTKSSLLDQEGHFP